jgi:hypothetical protein
MNWYNIIIFLHSTLITKEVCSFGIILLTQYIDLIILEKKRKKNKLMTKSFLYLHFFQNNKITKIFTQADCFYLVLKSGLT